MKRIVFVKNYTRDTALIMQQLWRLTLEDGVLQLGIKQKYAPVVVNFIKDGVCEIWENRLAISHIKREFASFCKQEPARALAFLRWFRRGLRELEPVWKQGKLNSLPALKDFIATVRKYMIGDVFIVCTGSDRRIIGPVKELAVRLRVADHYFFSSNQVIVASLRKIFPKLKDYVEALRLEDLDNPPARAELKERFHNYISVSDGYAKIETLAAYAKCHPYTFIKEKVWTAPGGIKGIAACLGRATGRARIIFSRRDLSKVKKGDIIISPMTTADMMPAIRRAAAIVTDEGGVICHAAIVARELKKPCLIATRAATVVFKDGDLVEVDVNQRVVRKKYKK